MRVFTTKLEPFLQKTPKIAPPRAGRRARGFLLAPTRNRGASHKINKRTRRPSNPISQQTKLKPHILWGFNFVRERRDLNPRSGP